VSIGETLAQSRQRAGLSVAQVSEQTRIRETIIRGVEDDEYSACGGDFYARGHIRAIAQAVGTDPGPLIREYDRVHRAPGAVWTVSLEELLATSAQRAQRRRPDLAAVGALVASACASARRRVRLPAVRELAARAPERPGRRVNWAVVLGLALAVVLGFGIYRVLPGSPRAVFAAPAAGNHAAAGPGARPSTPDLAPKASHAAAAPSTAPAMLARAPAPAHAAAAGRGARAQSRARPSGDQRSSPGRRLVHRRLHQRPLRESVPGHAAAPGHGPDGRGHQHAHQPGKVPGTGFRLRVGTKPALAKHAAHRAGGRR